MFNKEIHHHHNNSVILPSNIEIHEHRASTDDSVKILNEMEQKALDNVVLKITEIRPNSFSFSAVFCQIAQTDLLQKGLLYLKFIVNNKVYERKVKVGSLVMAHISIYKRESSFTDLDYQLQKLILFQITALIAECLLDTNPEILKDIMSAVTLQGTCIFDWNSIERSIEDSF